MAIQRGEAFWARLVREVEAGASQVAVARRQGVSASWLGRWCRRSRAPEPGRTTLLSVRVVDERIRRVELVVGAVRICFEEGTEPAYLVALARQLGS